MGFILCVAGLQTVVGFVCLLVGWRSGNEGGMVVLVGF